MIVRNSHQGLKIVLGYLIQSTGTNRKMKITIPINQLLVYMSTTLAFIVC
jgi:hypothetical protein